MNKVCKLVRIGDNIYVLSDDPIERQDFVFYDGAYYSIGSINRETNILQTDRNYNGKKVNADMGEFQKIIASTDSELPLFVIPQSVVDNYKKGIRTVDVRYYRDDDGWKPCTTTKGEIKIAEPMKLIFTYDEVEELLRRACDEGFDFGAFHKGSIDYFEVRRKIINELLNND